MAKWAACALVALVALGAVACGKMDPKDCAKLREQSFELLNNPNYCKSDADCKASEWPGCAKPINTDSFGKIAANKESFTKGKCEEKPLKCEPPAAVYCQEGMCAFKYPK
jgi:hypothetical protein